MNGERAIQYAAILMIDLNVNWPSKRFRILKMLRQTDFTYNAFVCLMPMTTLICTTNKLHIFGNFRVNAQHVKTVLDFTSDQQLV